MKSTQKLAAAPTAANPTAEDARPKNLPERRLSRVQAQIVLGALTVAIMAKLALLLVYAYGMRWVMDEFGQGTSGKLLDIGLYTVIDPIKTALPLVASHEALRLGTGVRDVFLWLRAGTTLAALLTVVVTACTAHSLHLRNWRWTLFVVVTLLCFSNFMEQSFRVRSDSYAALFSVVGFMCLMRPKETVRSVVLSGVMVGCAFLCTQKAIYIVAALGLGHLVRAQSKSAGAHWLTVALAYGCGATISLVVYAVAFGGLKAPQVLFAMFASPLKVSTHVLSGEMFPGIRRYVLQTLERNWFEYALCAAGVAVTLFRPSQYEPRVRAGALVVVLVTASVFSHPQPWPYVFVLCLPFLVLWAPFPLHRIHERHRALLISGACAALSVSAIRNVEVLSHDNRLQFSVAEEVESMLGPTDTYFDGVGMIPTRQIAGAHPWWWWDTPTLAALEQEFESGSSIHFASVANAPIKVWILNYRLVRMQARLNPLWANGTVRVAPTLLVSGRSMPSGATVRFRNLWRGRYVMVDEMCRPTSEPLVVDGVACETPCLISDGEHEISSAASDQRFLLPADVKPTHRLPVDGPVPHLYAEVYDF
jgi:hypothetical protein